MFRNLKVLGLLAVAALAMSAMVASAAQAQVKGIYTSGDTPSTHTGVHFHGVQHGAVTENYFEANGVKINCPNGQVMLTGTTTGSDTSLTVTPTYEGKCGTIKETEPNKDTINDFVTVNMNGCTYTFNQPTKVETNTYTATIDLKCTGTNSPIVSIYANSAHTIKLCDVTIEPNQTGIQHATLHNIDNGANPDHVTATVTAEHINYTNKTSTCPGGITPAGEPKTDGKYISNVTITSVETDAQGNATTTPAPDDVWISDEA